MKIWRVGAVLVAVVSCYSVYGMKKDKNLITPLDGIRYIQSVKNLFPFLSKATNRILDPHEYVQEIFQETETMMGLFLGLLAADNYKRFKKKVHTSVLTYTPYYIDKQCGENSYIGWGVKKVVPYLLTEPVVEESLKQTVQQRYNLVELYGNIIAQKAFLKGKKKESEVKWFTYKPSKKYQPEDGMRYLRNSNRLFKKMVEAVFDKNQKKNQKKTLQEYVDPTVKPLIGTIIALTALGKNIVTNYGYAHLQEKSPIVAKLIQKDTMVIGIGDMTTDYEDLMAVFSTIACDNIKLISQ